jgi:hypothetical protein
MVRYDTARGCLERVILYDVDEKNVWYEQLVNNELLPLGIDRNLTFHGIQQFLCSIISRFHIFF